MPRACTTISGEEIKAWLREIRIERCLLTARKRRRFIRREASMNF